MTELANEEDDLRAALDTAWTADDGGQAAAPVMPTAAPIADPAAPPADKAPARDEHGKFAPKITDQPAAAAQEAQPAPIPPASWSVEAKSMFATLPPAAQAEIAKRETDVAKGFEERASQLKRYEPLETAIAPHRDRLALAGVDEGTYVRSLIAADEMLRRPESRMQALAQIAQSYGIDLRQFAQPGQQQQPQQAQLPPVVQQLMRQVSTLESTLAQQASASEQAQRDQNLQAVRAFGADPKHLYFENVKGDMAALIQSGQAKDLEDAYDKAIWLRPDIRPLIQGSAAAQAPEAARAKADQARRAAGSITGSPSPGSAPAGQAAPSLRAELEAAWS